MENKTENKVAIVLLNWNQSDYTIKCLESLNKIDYKNFTVFLIDNGSKIEELKTLEDYISSSKLGIDFTKSSKNLGFTGGNNLLLQKVLDSKNYEYALLLNNDTEVELDFLTKLIEKINSDKKIGSVGPLVLNAIDKNIVDSASTKTIVSLAQGTLVGHGKNRSELEIKEKEVKYITGCAVLIRTEVLQEIGLLDNNFFAYFEDIDLGVRIAKKGYKNVFYPQSIVYHYGSISTGEKSEFYYFLSCRNRLIFAKKHTNVLWFIFIFLPYFLLWKIAVKFMTSKSKKNFIKGHLKGIFYFVTKKVLHAKSPQIL